MKVAASLLLTLLLVFLYNYLGSLSISPSYWRTVKAFGLILVPFIAIASPVMVLIAGLYFNHSGFADPKCGLPDLGFTFFCWFLGIPTSVVVQLAFNKSFYKPG